MSGHPTLHEQVMEKIRNTLQSVDDSKADAWLARVNIGVETRAAGDANARHRVALKCLHQLRRIICPAPAALRSVTLPCPRTNKAVCRMSGPTDTELELARRVSPSMTYGQLRHKLAQVEQTRAAAGPPRPPSLVCSNCASIDGIVDDMVTGDAVCTQCGMVASKVMVSDTGSNSCMYSEPIRGHRRAQRKCDMHSGMSADKACISDLTRYKDEVEAREFISHLCDAYGVGRRATLLAIAAYLRIRKAYAHVENREHTLAACIIVGRRQAMDTFT